MKVIGGQAPCLSQTMAGIEQLAGSQQLARVNSCPGMAQRDSTLQRMLWKITTPRGTGLSP